jgi:hypothetical protein
VVLNGNVFGVFSYRSFAKTIVSLGEDLLKDKQLPGDLEVEECLEQAKYAHITDNVNDLFETIDRQDVVLVGQPNRIVGVLTAIDVLRYLYGVASPFVLIAEIEISLRALIAQAVTDNELRDCCDRSLKQYQDDKRPYELVEMTFSDYVQIVGHGESWAKFRGVFGGTRSRTSAKLKEVNRLRNDVFHFRREITVKDYEDLAELRDWMLRKAMQVEFTEKGENS